MEQLHNSGYKTIYVRPIFLLLDKFGITKRLAVISPRRASTSNISSNSSSSSLKKLNKYLFGFIGYSYALLTYLYLRFIGLNKIVVCDRYFYQFFYDLFGENSYSIAMFFPRPDITYMLCSDVQSIYPRMTSEFDASVKETYYIGVLDLYRKISKRYCFIRIDANLDYNLINDIIYANLLNDRRILHD